MSARARATALAQFQHEQRRDASPIDHSDEIIMLERTLAGDLSPYTPAGVRTMRERLLILKADKMEAEAIEQAIWLEWSENK